MCLASYSMNRLPPFWGAERESIGYSWINVREKSTISYSKEGVFTTLINDSLHLFKNTFEVLRQILSSDRAKLAVLYTFPVFMLS